MQGSENRNKQYKILIVEDSPVQVEVLRRILVKQGYGVYVAKDGSEGLAMAGKFTPSLIISDIIMPVMDGYNMCGKVKENEKLRNIPFLLLTQLIEPEEVIRGLESGADGYFTKPFNEFFLLSKIKTLLENPGRFKNRPDRKSIEFEYDGKHYEVHSGRTQTLSYLISTYENAVLKTKELEKAHEDLIALNGNLEKKVEERTIELKNTNDVLQVEVLERKKAEETIRQMAYFDTLTELPNKTRLYQHLSDCIKDGSSKRNSFALLLINLNRFREINEVLGYDQGNDLLKTVGRRLQELVNNKGMLARNSADEFAILIPGADSELAISYAKNTFKILDDPFEISGIKLYIQPSIGITLFPGHGNNADLLIRRAEMAMHQAKGVGRIYSIYSGGFEQGISRRFSMAGDLRYAIENNQLNLYCQPKIDIKTGRICGAEALLRWHHPKESLIPPAEFIPLAEHTGLIRPLTYWVLETSIRQCFAWQEEGLSMPISVNLSVRNLHDPILLEKIHGLLMTWGIKPGNLEVELTESAFTEEPAVYATLTQIRNMGIKIFIDDFGTGYSSLSYLQRLPIDAIKIDKSFVLNMIKDNNSATIVNSVITLAHNMKLKVVAEGVENKEIYDMLSGCSCNYAQGFYISRPIPAEEFSNWVKNSSWL